MVWGKSPVEIGLRPKLLCSSSYLLQSFYCKVVDSELIDGKLVDDKIHKLADKKDAQEKLGDFRTLEILGKCSHRPRTPCPVDWTSAETQISDLFLFSSLILCPPPPVSLSFLLVFLLSLLSNARFILISYKV